MSEVLTAYRKQKLEWALKPFSEPPLDYEKQQASKQYEFLFYVEIPWPLLHLWIDLVDGNPVKLSYIDLLNSGAVDGLFTIKRVLTHRGAPTQKS